MGGLRRRLRREARSAAKQLVRQGVPARSIGRIVEDERVNRVLMRIVEEMEKRLDGKGSSVSVREGLAAIKEIRALKAEQQEALQNDAAMADAEMLEDEIEENAQSAGDVKRLVAGADGSSENTGATGSGHTQAGALSAAG